MLTATHPLYPLVEAQNRLFRARQTQSAAEFGSGASMVETAASGLGRRRRHETPDAALAGVIGTSPARCAT